MWMGKKIACKTQPTFHLFWCWFKSLNVLGHWIILLLQKFGQEFTSNGWCPRRKLSPWKRFQDICITHKIKLVFSNIITSFWLTFVPSWTCHIGSTWNLSTTYFSPKHPTQQFKSLWQNQNLWHSQGPPLKLDHQPS